MPDEGARLGIEGREKRHRTVQLYSSAVHSSPEPSGSVALIARHMIRRAPIATVATITTVLMTHRVRRNADRVIVQCDQGS
jgi:hypothetical protein